MSEPVAPSSLPPLVVPAGASIIDAATWVGHTCWAELRLHQVLTGWLAIEPDGATSVAWWAIRSHRAELAELWHRRLPELRELPRAGFVESGDDVERILAPVTDRHGADLGPTGRADALRAVLTGLLDRYRAHLARAVGPADGPTARTLELAIARTEADRR